MTDKPTIREPRAMMPAHLLTEQGASVWTVEVPDFDPIAPAIVWGGRVFTYHEEVDGELMYHEVFAYTVPS